MKYAEKYGVSRASRKFMSYICFWRQRRDGTAAPLACQSRHPRSHPNQHVEAGLKLIRDMRRRNPTPGMLEHRHRLRQRGYTRHPESLFRVMRKMGLFPSEKPKKTDNGFKFTNRFSSSRRELPTLLEHTAAGLDIRRKLIRPYTTRHNGKVERAAARTRSAFTPVTSSILRTISQSSSPPAAGGLTACQ